MSLPSPTAIGQANLRSAPSSNRLALATSTSRLPRSLRTTELSLGCSNTQAPAVTDANATNAMNHAIELHLNHGEPPDQPQTKELECDPDGQSHVAYRRCEQKAA